MPKLLHLRLATTEGHAVDHGPRLSPEAIEALRQLCDLARTTARDELLMAGLDADPTLGEAVRRLARFRP
jgi:hypothetical protein